MRSSRLVVALSLLAGSLVIAALSRHAAVASTVPGGFTDSLIAAFEEPTSIGRLPDGRTLIAAKAGTLWVIGADGVKQSTPAIALADACTNSERGLLGVTADPGFATNSRVYLYATRTVSGVCQNRVARYTLSGSPAMLTGETVLLDKIPSPAGNHNGGDLKFGNDGLLYVTVGDGGCAAFDGTKCAANNPAAQRTNIVSGKILRITADGAIPPGNMFTSGAVRCQTTGQNLGGEPCAEIYAMGLRNPFRMVPDLQISGTRFLINDVGQDTQEEVDNLVGGGNYGWNQWEGSCLTGQRKPCDNGISHAGFIDPLYSYNHYNRPSGECGAITAGVLPPAGWTGKAGRTYLYADLLCGTIFEVADLGGANVVTDFATDTGPVIDMQMVQEPGGWAMYYATFANGGEVRRMRPSGAMTLPGPGRLVPITPTRVLDTRGDIGTSVGKPKADSTTTFHLPEAVVPSGATAVAVNVTGVSPAAAGFVTVWPSWVTRPITSNLNFAYAGEMAANAMVMPVRAGGDINLYTYSSAHLIVDVTGYWLPATTATAGRFTVTKPSRILDTRSGLGAPQAPIAALGRIDLRVTGRGGVPSAGVSAVAMVVTSVTASAPGFVTVWPTDQPLPMASSLNPMGGDVRANLVIVPVSAGGQVSLYSWSQTDLLADVAGWFTDASAPSSSSGLLQPIMPTRLIDTRANATTRLSSGQVTSVKVDLNTSVNDRVVVYNLTATGTGAPGFMTAFPVGSGRPEASNVNFEAAGQTRAALAITKGTNPGGVGQSPNVELYASASTDYIVDEQAYFL